MLSGENFVFVVNVPGYNVLPSLGIPNNFFPRLPLLIYELLTATFNHKMTVIYEAYRSTYYNFTYFLLVLNSPLKEVKQSLYWK